MKNTKGNKSKIKTLFVLSALVLSMSGCGNVIPEMTDEERQQIGEYAAVLLLKHDANSRSRLVDAAVIEEDERRQAAWEAAGKIEATPSPEEEGMRPIDDTPVVEADKEDNMSSSSLEEYFALQQGVSINYVGYHLSENYPENGEEDYFTLEASEGKKLLILDFGLQNATGEEADIDLFAKDASYRVIINEEHSYNMMTTMLLNDMSTYVGRVPAGNNENLVLIAEIDRSVADNITTMTINLKNESKAYKFQVL